MPALCAPDKARSLIAAYPVGWWDSAPAISRPESGFFWGFLVLSTVPDRQAAHVGLFSC